MTIRRPLARAPIAVAAALLVAAAPHAARAQGAKVNSPPSTMPAKLPNTATVTIGGAYAVSFTNPPLVVTSQQGNPCNPGECLTGTATVRANGRWMLQVRHASPPTTFYVNLLGPAPTYVATRLSTTAWATVAQGTTATAAQSATTFYNANKVNGVPKLPTAAQVQASLEYRVIALP